MKDVAKYNTFKGVSTALTFGTPIATLLCCSDFFVQRSETAISVAGIFTLLITALFMKDKLAEKFKSPSALIISVAVLVLIVLTEHIILPMKYVCIATISACGVDEITFKRWYKQVEARFPEQASTYKHLGFIFAKSEQIESLEK